MKSPFTIYRIPLQSMEGKVATGPINNPNYDEQTLLSKIKNAPVSFIFYRRTLSPNLEL